MLYGILINNIQKMEHYQQTTIRVIVKENEEDLKDLQKGGFFNEYTRFQCIGCGEWYFSDKFILIMHNICNNCKLK